jgi:hypothetical protein
LADDSIDHVTSSGRSPLEACGYQGSNVDSHHAWRTGLNRLHIIQLPECLTGGELAKISVHNRGYLLARLLFKLDPSALRAEPRCMFIHDREAIQRPVMPLVAC